MPNVKMSEKLRSEILSAAMQVFDKREQEVRTWPAEITAERVFNAYMGSTIGLRAAYDQALAFNLLQNTNQYKVSFLCGKSMIFRVPVTNPDKHKHLPEGGSYDSGLNLEGSDAQAMLEILTKWQEAMEDFQKTELAFRTQLNALLEKHTTLKTLIAEWEPVWAYVPSWAKTRYMEPGPERKKNERAAVQVDTGLLNNAVVTARVLDAV